MYNEIEFNNAVIKFSEGKVPDINTHTLFKLYENYVVLDCREADEFEVSHLKNSICVGYHSFDITNIPHHIKNKNIVVYCTIGWRSEKIGEKLIQQGYKNVYNLKGSILKWNNDGYPLYTRDNVKTNKIHTYNNTFAKYVKSGQIIDK